MLCTIVLPLIEWGLANYNLSTIKHISYSLHEFLMIANWATLSLFDSSMSAAISDTYTSELSVWISIQCHRFPFGTTNPMIMFYDILCYKLVFICAVIIESRSCFFGSLKFMYVGVGTLSKCL